MKNTVMKRAIITVLTLILSLMFVLSSCGEKEGPPAETTGDSSETTQAEPLETELVPELPKDINFKGKTFKILSRLTSGLHFEEFSNFELFTDAYNSDPINDAVYDRNLEIQNKYEVTITQVQQKEVLPYLQSSVMAEDHAYDVVVSSQKEIASASTNGLLYNLFDVPHIDLEKPWWDSNSVSGFSIGNRLYFVDSSWLLLDKQRTSVMYFNKQMAGDLNIENLYQTVLDGKWTVDKLHELMLVAAKDNGNQIADLSDVFGMSIDSSGTYGDIFHSCGNIIVSKDEDDIPILSLYTERANTTMDKIIELFRNKSICVTPGDWQTEYKGESVWFLPTELFCSSQALFYGGLAYNAQGLSQKADFDFGIISFPKLDESQEKYYTKMQPTSASVICIPIDSNTLEMTGVLLEDLSYLSKKNVVPVYYEEWLKVRYTKDEESAAMLDMIFDNIVYDLGAVFNWGNALGIVQNSTTNIFGSSYASREKSILSAMQTTIDSFTS